MSREVPRAGCLHWLRYLNQPIFPTHATQATGLDKLSEMTEPTQPVRNAQPKLAWCWLSGLIFAGGLGLALYQGVLDPAPALRHPAIITTAYTSFALWVGAVALMIPAKRSEWHTGAVRFRVARFTWILAVFAYLVHVAVAFHFAHRWQHAKAFEHVQVTSGYGPGIYVSYVFTVFWAADAFWVWMNPQKYLVRKKWLQISIHLLIAFIMLQATVVYGHGVGRVGSAAVFAVLVLAMLWKWVQKKTSPD
jgi:hypothetical protein